jgi:DNA repair protein RadD
MYKLRDYQLQSVDKGLEILTSKNLRKEVIVLPTGAGKSIVIAKIVQSLDENIIVLQPSKELLLQNYSKFVDVGGEASLFSASVGEKEIGKVTFATIGSIIKACDKLKELKITKLIVDEAHIGVKSGSQLRKLLKQVGIKNVLGLTATPFVLESTMEGAELKMLTRLKNKLFTDISYVYQIKQMLQNEYWTPLQYKVVNQDTDTLRINSSGSDFTEESMRKYYESNDLSAQIVEYVQKSLDYGKKSILVFVPSIEEANMLERKIKYSKSVSSLTPKKERDEIISSFKKGITKVVINVGILTTGFDYPELDTIILARSTMSFALYYQMIGRGVRIHPDKDKTLVIDLSENYNRFGRVEQFTVDYVEGYGWGLFRGEDLITNYPIEAKKRPQKKNLTRKIDLNPAGEVIMPFGKHKGSALSELAVKEKSYLVWFYENINFSNDKAKLKKEIERLLNLS